MTSFPEVYILGREVNGVFVEYYYAEHLKGLVANLSLAEWLVKNQTTTETVGTWRILKYGNPMPVK